MNRALRHSVADTCPPRPAPSGSVNLWICTRQDRQSLQQGEKHKQCQRRSILLYCVTSYLFCCLPQPSPAENVTLRGQLCAPTLPVLRTSWIIILLANIFIASCMLSPCTVEPARKVFPPSLQAYDAYFLHQDNEACLLFCKFTSLELT